MQNYIIDGSTMTGTLYVNGEPYEALSSSWMHTAEISPWEPAQTEVSADEIVRLFSRMEWLERRVETLMRRLDELGLTDVSDLI